MSKNKAKILIAEDDDTQREEIKEYLIDEGFDVDEACDGIEAISKIESNKYDVIIADMIMPAPRGIDEQECGLELLKQSKKRHPETRVIILTAYAKAKTYEAAQGRYVYRYIDKPVELDNLSKYIKDALAEKEVGAPFLDKIVAKSQQMREVLNTALRAAEDPDSTILITGESGTGKELIARAIHYNSPRREKPFIPVDCASIPSELMESELFGHQKGAFTGATARKQGFFEVANGGTLFLDEIGELRPDLQVKLLRALQEKEILPIGFTRAIPVDVRIISATNKNIDEAISHGEFREDLYYRLNVINIHIPPLRERPEDIKPTAEFFFRKLQEEKHKLYLTIADSVWALLSSYDWPGNVRELRNTIESAVVLAKGDEILPEHFLKKEAHLLNEPGNQYQIVGKSAAILELMKQIGIVAPQDVTVLIYGETGSGKELVARNIHLNSKRSQAKFEARNCGAFSEQLLESELFGHEKGAFTGAIRQRKGIFEDADGGTIFLDEIGNTSLNLQQKLLRVLQEREFERVGGNETIKTDIRLIAATNKDLKEEVKQGKFREDLFYRLNVIPLHIPPLRDRKEDIPLLAHYFREKFSREHEKSIRDFDDKVIEIFKDYSWPGNVRELENAIERAVTYCEGADIIAEMHLPPHIVKERKDDDGISIFDSFLSIETFEEACNAFSKYFLEAKLKENDWNVKQTAERIKHARSKVYEKMKDYGIMRS